MKGKWNNKYVKLGVTVFLTAAAIICFYYLVFHSSNLRANLGIISDILMPVLFGLGMGYLLTPVLNFLEKKVLTPLCNFCRVKDSPLRKKSIRGAGIFLTGLLFFLLIYSLFAMLLSQIVPSIQSIVDNFDIYLNNITIWLNNLLADNAEIRDYVVRNVNRYSTELESWINSTIFTWSSELIKTVSLSILGVFGAVWDFILGFIISIYVLASKETFAGQAKKVAYAIFSQENANILINNFRFIHKTFIGFVGGKILDSILIGLICFIGTTILNTPYAALVSLIIGITNVIPFFGPFLGAIPTTVLIFVVDPLHPLNCVYYIIFILILQQVDGNIIGPKILGNSTGISGFWVIFAITVFGGLFGVLGMIVGVPIFAVFFAFMRALVNGKLRKKDMKEETTYYIQNDIVEKQPGDSVLCNGQRVFVSMDDIGVYRSSVQSVQPMEEAVIPKFAKDKKLPEDNADVDNKQDIDKESKVDREVQH